MDIAQIGEISRRYRSGQSTSDIARDLRLRSVDVIACIRGLQPPSMGTRIARPSTVERPAPVMPAPVVPAAVPVRAAPAPAPAARPHRRPAPATQPAVQPVAPVVAAEPEDTDDDEPVVRQGCPPGWLVTEAEYHAAFERSGGRFVDAVLRQR